LVIRTQIRRYWYQSNSWSWYQYLLSILDN